MRNCDTVHFLEFRLYSRIWPWFFFAVLDKYVGVKKTRAPFQVPVTFYIGPTNSRIMFLCKFDKLELEWTHCLYFKLNIKKSYNNIFL